MSDRSAVESRLRAEIATIEPAAILAMLSVVGAWVRLPAQPRHHTLGPGAVRG